MTKMGRNDPCPCGSGRKYKHCCLREEAAGKSEAIGRDRAWETMTDKLHDFSRQDRFRQDLESAFDLFWNRSYTSEQINSLAPGQIMSFLDWYVHDYRTAADGKRIAELLLEGQGPGLSEQERELLQVDSGALLSAFEVTAVEEGSTIGLLDVFQDLEVQVQYVPSLQGISAGQLLVARLAVTDEFRRISWISVLIPPELEVEFKTFVEEMFAGYQDEHYQASWAEFLRERSYLFNHFLLKVSGDLAPPKILVPDEETREAERRPTVHTPTNVEQEERPSVLIPGQSGREPPSRVLVPGRDV